MNASPLSLQEIAKAYPALERLKGEARGPIRLSGALNDLTFTADLEMHGGRALVAGRLTRNERPRYTGDAALYSWLRSRDLNVEVAGDLTSAFLLSDTDALRTAQDLRLSGFLRAARGTCQLAGPGISRRFAIREGTIEFPGTPDVDPGLAFNAVYRARSSRRDEPIDIIAVVGGTLRSPHIRLTSDDESLISESDLASYLFFGVPTYELTASQSEAVSQATAGFSFAASSGFGYRANGLQTVAQNFGLLDYVSLTAAEAQVGIQTQGAIASLFAGTRLELGRYVGRDGQIYIAYSQSLTANGYRRPGVRVEWQLKSALTGEVFVEDRFARTPDSGSRTSPKNGFMDYSCFVNGHFWRAQWNA